MRAIIFLVAASIASLTGYASLAPAAQADGLRPFANCEELLDRVRTEATEIVGPFGWYSHGDPFPEMMAMESRGELAPTAPQTKSGPAFSDTNIQEEGVDEPDVVKTDGVHIFTASGRTIRALLARSGHPEQVGVLKLKLHVSHMLLYGERLLIVGDAYTTYRGNGSVMDEPVSSSDDSPFPEDSPSFGDSPSFEDSVSSVDSPSSEQLTTTLVQVDVSDPTNMRVVGSAEVPGYYLSARAVDGIAHLVTSHIPDFDFVSPHGKRARSEQEATRINQQIIADSQLDDWLPTAEIDGKPAGHIDCTAVMHPDEFAGPGLVSVLSFDMSEPITIDNSAAVLADGHEVYSSPDNLYVATRQWHPWGFWDDIAPGIQEKRETQIHKFHISGSTEYVASGTVRGDLLNQFSMSEHDGDLRVASTDFDARRDGDGSQSFVTILRPSGSELRQIGRVGDLGRGEEIFAVRFLGDTGYIVTFQVTDPLYTVDLSQPEQPKVLGELKIKGFSAYLHPLADGRLLGVGQDATARGRRLGTQVSLFDVSDLSRPDRLDQWSPPGGWSDSDVEYDHHAFMYWAQTGTIVMPVSDRHGTRMVVLDVHDSTVTHRGSISVPQRGWGPLRSLVIDDSLYTISKSGVIATNLESLQRTGGVSFDD